jgi:hypothetical protein
MCLLLQYIDDSSSSDKRERLSNHVATELCRTEVLGVMWRSLIISCRGHVDDAGIVMAQTAERRPQAAVSDGGASAVVLLLDSGPCAGRPAILTLVASASQTLR